MLLQHQKRGFMTRFHNTPMHTIGAPLRKPVITG
jgi:hypothetical protein